MFSRRHPFLFFSLIMSAITGTVIVVLVVALVLGSSSGTFDYGEKVGVVEVNGVIVDARSILEQLEQLRKDERVKSLVVRIDSPGGAVGPAQEIYREIQKTRLEKKVIASLGTVAASGGYYIAAAADGIIASPGTVTGSIGVLMAFTDYRDLLSKIGLQPVVIKSGAYKDMGSGTREMTEAERDVLTGLTHQIHEQFVRDVAAGRKMDPETVRGVADGRIFTGETFQQMGFIDRSGNYADAVAWAAELGGITGAVSTLSLEKKPYSFLDYIAGTVLKQTLQRWLTPSLFPGYLYRPGGGFAPVG
ncbi:MAG: signal peptide peptidase SppA [Pseudomonadota bacterium]